MVCDLRRKCVIFRFCGFSLYIICSWRVFGVVVSDLDWEKVIPDTFHALACLTFGSLDALFNMVGCCFYYCFKVLGGL